MTMNKHEAQVAAHAAMANRILKSTHALSVTGKIDFTDGKPWEYDWPLLDCLISRLPKMHTVEVCEENTSYGGCWTRRELDLDFQSFGIEYRGTLSVSRYGPGLEECYWSFNSKIPVLEVA